MAGVACGVAVIILLTYGGLHEPIAMGLGLGVFSTVQMRSLGRFSKARYGEEFRFGPALLLIVLGMAVMIVILELLDQL